MKRIKRIAGLVLAMVMVFAMSVTAFATNTPTNMQSGSENDGKFTLTIGTHEGGDAKGYVYAAYQIFKGDLYNDGTTKTLSNIEWGDDVDLDKVKIKFSGKTASEVAKGITNSAATTNQTDTNEAKAFAAEIATCLKEGVAGKSSTVTKNDEDKVTGYVISDLAAGYYLVQNTAIPNYEGEIETADAFTRYIMEIVGNAEAAPKSDVPTSDKKIVENDKKVDVNNAAIGDTVSYEIKGTLPSNFSDFKTYYYVFTDTLSKGLTPPAATDIKVEVVNGAQKVDVSKYFYRNVAEVENTGVHTITVGIVDLIALNLLKDVDVTVDKDSEIIVTYNATVNQEAEIGSIPNTNDVELDFSNNPNTSGSGTTTPPGPNPPAPTTKDPTGKTPKKEVKTYVTELSILKVDENGNPLAGVEFTLTSTDGKKITLVTTETFKEDTNGAYWKLKNGSYTTTAPIVEDETDDEGNVTVKNNAEKYESVTTKYSLTKVLTTTEEGNEGTTAVKGTVDSTTGRVTFTGLGAGNYRLEESKTPAGYNTIDAISFEITFDATKEKFASNNDKIALNSVNTFETTIENKKGSLLPSTGGIGTTIFYVVGSILVIGAGILLVTKRRMKAQ